MTRTRWIALAAVAVCLVAAGVIWRAMAPDNQTLSGDTRSPSPALSPDTPPTSNPDPEDVPLTLGIELEELRMNPDREITPEIRYEIEKAEALKMGSPLVNARERTAQRHQELQIDGAELAAMDTAELMEAIAANPLKVFLFFENHPDGGLRTLTEKYNGIAELLARPDAAKAALDFYLQITERIDQREDETSDRIFDFVMAELFLSSPQLVRQWDAAGHTAVIRAVLKSHHARMNYDSRQAEPVYGLATLPYRAAAIAKSLDTLADPAYRRWKEGRPEIFVERYLNHDEAEQIIALGEAYLQNLKAD